MTLNSEIQSIGEGGGYPGMYMVVRSVVMAGAKLRLCCLRSLQNFDEIFFLPKFRYKLGTVAVILQDWTREVPFWISTRCTVYGTWLLRDLPESEQLWPIT